MKLPYPRCRTSALLSLNFIRLLSAHFPRLSRALSIAALPSRTSATFSDLVFFANLPRVLTLTSRLLIKTLSNTGPRINQRYIPKLVTVHQSDFEPSSPGNYRSTLSAHLSSPYPNNLRILQQSMSKALLKSKWHPPFFPCPQTQSSNHKWQVTLIRCNVPFSKSTLAVPNHLLFFPVLRKGFQKDFLHNRPTDQVQQSPFNSELTFSLAFLFMLMYLHKPF